MCVCVCVSDWVCMQVCMCVCTCGLSRANAGLIKRTQAGPRPHAHTHPQVSHLHAHTHTSERGGNEGVYVFTRGNEGLNVFTSPRAHKKKQVESVRMHVGMHTRSPKSDRPDRRGNGRASLGLIRPVRPGLTSRPRPDRDTQLEPTRARREPLRPIRMPGRQLQQPGLRPGLGRGSAGTATRADEGQTNQL